MWFAKPLSLPSNVKTHLVPQPHCSQGYNIATLADLTRCFLNPPFLFVHVNLAVHVTRSIFATPMALDWTFPSLPNANFDAQFLEPSELGPYQHGDNFFSSLEWSDDTSNIIEDGASNIDPARVSVEPWTGLGCTCGLSFITCSEHNSALGTDGVSGLSDVGLWCDNAQATQRVRPECAAIPDAHEENIPPTDKNLYGSPRREEVQEDSKPKKKRSTKISAEAKSKLEKHFTRNPYPACKELDRLAKSTKLSSRSISMWFSNSRARRKICHRKYYQCYRDVVLATGLHWLAALTPEKSPGLAMCSEHMAKTRETSPMSVVSSASLEALNRLSPVSDILSLEKFLSTPASEDPVSATVLAEAILDAPPERPFPQTYNSAPLPPRRPVSVACSISSAGSARSFQSWRSARSNDSRGSRRGRKGWKKYDSGQSTAAMTHPKDSRLRYTPGPRDPLPYAEDQTSPLIVRAARDGEDDEDRTLVMQPFFCTWPSCSSRFQYRYDWSRPEEALHYCPFHWVCCSENDQVGDQLPCLICTRNDHTATQHCRSCSTKDVQSRAFLREDQLAQHIKRAHLPSDTVKPKISKQLLSAWKIDNPSFPMTLLRCGFCGLVFETWAQRQSHVHNHLKKGVCKSSWWPEREPEVYHTSTK
jgi:hypothetical protein